MAMIADRVELARRGANDAVICRLPSGWAVIGDVRSCLANPTDPQGPKPPERPSRTRCFSRSHSHPSWRTARYYRRSA